MPKATQLFSGRARPEVAEPVLQASPQKASPGLHLLPRLQLLVLTLIIFYLSTMSRICHLPPALLLTPANSLGINWGLSFPAGCFGRMAGCWGAGSEGQRAAGPFPGGQAGPSSRPQPPSDLSSQGDSYQSPLSPGLRRCFLIVKGVPQALARPGLASRFFLGDYSFF